MSGAIAQAGDGDRLFPKITETKPLQWLCDGSTSMLSQLSTIK
ncbi:hypothetical protein [Stenomitos frigidus]|nr:hypothetical protein [Stenomitos frigidus]